MPLYDDDGTASYPIGKVYDDDGTALHQIGKVYDHDGTALHLNYSAEEILFENGVSGIAGVPAMHAYHTNGTYVGKFILSKVARVELCNTTYTYVAFPTAVDFSKYSKLKARVKKCGSNEKVAAALGANVSDYWGTVTSTQALYNLADGAHFEIAVNVSGFNSKTRPWFGLATTDNTTRWAQVEYEKIWLE